MKKIAIMTFHRALNYGAKLQAFALMETINNKYNAYILDYRCNKIENFYFNIYSAKNIIKKFVFPRYSYSLSKRKRNFKIFDLNYRLSDIYNNSNIINANNYFDAFVVGSDQVWNPEITGFDYNYFLPFADNEKAYTYAVSFGKAKISDWNNIDIKVLLNKFKLIMVREKSSEKMLKEFNSNILTTTVLDPVFLLSKESWICKMHLNKNSNKQKYIFVYIVAQQTYTLEVAKKIAKKFDYNILFIDAGRKCDSEFTKINDAGPIEFLELLLNAELVLTTSFHALAFSLIFNIPFLYELSKEKINANSRLSDLSEALKINNYEILNADKEYINTYDWESINRKIENMRELSIGKLYDELDS